MHSAEVIYNKVLQSTAIKGCDLVEAFSSVYARSTVLGKLQILVQLGMLKSEGGGPADQQTYSVQALFNLRVVQADIKQKNINSKVTGRTTKQSPESAARREQRHQAGMDGRTSTGAIRRKRRAVQAKPYSGDAFAWSGEQALANAQAVQNDLAKTIHAEEAVQLKQTVVDVAVDAVMAVPIRHLPELRQRLKEVLAI